MEWRDKEDGMMHESGTMKLAAGHGAKPADDPAARRLIQEAHGRMYRWPADFAGYRATLLLNDEGKIYRGRMSLVPRKATTVELDGADAALQEWARERLWTQGMHLAYSTFEEGDGKYVLSFDEEEDSCAPHPRGRRVLLTGGRLDSWYRIKYGQYTQIGRITPMTERRVNTIERCDHAPDGKQYSSHYVMTYFSLDGQSVIGMESYVNEYTDVKGMWLPLRRRVSFGERGLVKTRIIELSEHEV
jgi:hypothetical protein